MSLRALFHQMPPGMRTPYAQLDSAGRSLRDTHPESLAAAARTSIPVEFIWGRLDLSRTEGIVLTAQAARTHIPVLSSSLEVVKELQRRQECPWQVVQPLNLTPARRFDIM
jgi:hypothetical protein